MTATEQSPAEEVCWVIPSARARSGSAVAEDGRSSQTNQPSSNSFPYVHIISWIRKSELLGSWHYFTYQARKSYCDL